MFLWPRLQTDIGASQVVRVQESQCLAWLQGDVPLVPALLEDLAFRRASTRVFLQHAVPQRNAGLLTPETRNAADAVETGQHSALVKLLKRVVAETLKEANRSFESRGPLGPPVRGFVAD